MESGQRDENRGVTAADIFNPLPNPPRSLVNYYRLYLGPFPRKPTYGTSRYSASASLLTVPSPHRLDDAGGHCQTL